VHIDNATGSHLEHNRLNTGCDSATATEGFPESLHKKNCKGDLQHAFVACSYESPNPYSQHKISISFNINVDTAPRSNGINIFLVHCIMDPIQINPYKEDECFVIFF